MFKPVRIENEQQAGPRPRRRRRLRTVAMLPTLLTLGNLYFGFAAIYSCVHEAEDLGKGTKPSEVRTLNSPFLEKRAPSYLSIAVWMLIGAMICDALDGRVARRTGQASKFGVELDSLADVVSFGVAPAMMMITLTRREFPGLGSDHYVKAAVFVGVIYAWCAALRLARFNVETSMEEAAHRGFRGLPSPGAAAAVISLIFLHDHLLDPSGQWAGTTRLLATLLPICTLAAALLMVSRVPYTHAVSSFLRRRPFGHVIPTLLIIPLALLYTEAVALIAAWSFVLSGPLQYLWNKAKGQPLPVEADMNNHPPQLEKPPASKQAQ